MGRVCESAFHKANPPPKDLADIVGHNITRFEVPQDQTKCEDVKVPRIIDKCERPIRKPICEQPSKPLCDMPCNPVCDRPLKNTKCLDPYGPNKMCDDLLAGIVPDDTNISDDRCKVTDPLHQKNKRFCGVKPSDYERVTECCDNLNTKVCADFFCTSDALYYPATTNYFKNAEPLSRRTKCKYPFPCRAHCFATPPRRNPLYDCVLPPSFPAATRYLYDSVDPRCLPQFPPSVAPQCSPCVAEPLQFTMQKRSVPSTDRNNEGPRMNYFVGTGYEVTCVDRGRNGI